MQLVCASCALATGDDSIACERCGAVPAFSLSRPTVDAAELRERFALRRLSNEPRDQSGVWRFRELLPHIDDASIVTLRENVVPTYAAVQGAAYAGVRSVAYLHLGMNPTASFKDAGMTVAISRARERGQHVAVCASTGNTAASMAAYAARAGIAAVVVVPKAGVSEAKVAQTLDYGAAVMAIDGDFDRALGIVRSLDPARVAVLNSVNPYRIEGQKCAGYVLLEARDWRAPDWVVMPGGNLGNASAFGKCFREALALGLIERLPRIAVVQASGAAPFERAFRDGTELVPIRADTAASAIRIGAPASWRKALREVRESAGTVIAVPDDEIADARAVIGRDGVGCEPASAASLAGLRRLRDAGTVSTGDDVVLVLTGHVLKDGAFAARYHARGGRFANPVRRMNDEASLRSAIDVWVGAHA